MAPGNATAPLLPDRSTAMEAGGIRRLPATLHKKTATPIPQHLRAPLEKLKREGKVAPATILYNANTPLRYVFSLGGTTVKLCLESLAFWLVVSLNVFLTWLYYGYFHNSVNFDGHFNTGGWPFVSGGMWASFASLNIFLLVLHTVDCYGRFEKQYGTVRAIEGRILSLVTLLRTKLPDDAFPGAKDLRLKIARWAVAQTYLGFGWLPTSREADLDEWTWERVIQSGLIGQEEETALLGMPAEQFPVLELETYASQYLWDARKEIGEGVAAEVMASLSAITKGFYYLYQCAAMPVPFALYHLITVLNTGFLLATAYQFVFYAGYWGIVPVTFTALAFQGLRELASVLADPLGNDDTDIPVLDYVVEWHSTVESTVNLPRARQPRKMA